MTKARNFGATVATLFLACALGPLAHASTLSTDVISMFPQSAGEFAYADLRQARSSLGSLNSNSRCFRRASSSSRNFLPPRDRSESQVEELAWALVPNSLPTGAAANTAVPSGEEILGVALGTFQPESAQAYFQDQKLPVVKVREFSLYAFGGGSGATDLFFCFIDRNTAAFGQRQELEKLIAVRQAKRQAS